MTVRAAIYREIGQPLSLEAVGIRPPTGHEVAVDLAAGAVAANNDALGAARRGNDLRTLILFDR